ncbi:MAG: DUF2911 domain-containing protein [Flavobacteriales bacterium]|nr:DUF2911 domain-containing protein [Bacteroidota bacterium]MCB9241347.1 DUF2911 domain-containing protein [Flavobacteriales bacterium]
MKKFVIGLMMLSVNSLMTTAQINVPQPSPLGTVTQKVGLVDISINYSRPGVKGRVIFGDLVQFGEIWRLGANASTKLNLSNDVTIEGHDVPGGEYALYAIPEQDKWTVIIHKNTTYWGVGDKYTPEEDLVRFDVPVNANYPIKVETMTFEIADVTSDACNIVFTWENTEVKLNVKTNTDQMVMSEINQKMKGISSATYYQAARYYLENDKDMNQALEWINKSLEENDKFWVHRQKSLILAKLGRYAEAVETAETSKKLALADGNKDYVRLNDKSIEEWTPLITKKELKEMKKEKKKDKKNAK